jgi:preprotein translocase subunit SecY
MLMWMGEQITARGIGNGISLIIFAGIVAELPRAIYNLVAQARTTSVDIGFVLAIAFMVIALIVFIVFIERSQRRLIIHYPKRQQSQGFAQGQRSFLPLKINTAGVIPPIFASSIILFPATLSGWFGQSESMVWLRDVAGALAPGQPVYVALYASAIVFFCFFYTALVFNPKETADNLKRSGAFIPGIRPGDQTAKYIDKVTMRLTMAGAVYITLVCLLPEFLVVALGTPFYFGGTSLLIIVVVSMDFMTQVQAHMMSQQYEGLLKKANFKGMSPLAGR